MREVDRFVVDEVGLDLLQMMENAGRNLALTAGGMRSDPDANHVVVLAGAGGNGGGGLCAARHLANHGVDVTVVAVRRSVSHPVAATIVIYTTALVPRDKSSHVTHVLRFSETRIVAFL